ncbi:hypothetical protein DWUX_1348 [Desulfovibrio diazotrophicus]|nr:hypothetical protein DWUX_1348 [Desulfovibrio diazotrophicus]
MALRSFNPRPREGATRQRTVLSASPSVSIHAPVKGRLPATQIMFGYTRFNPRPREGATCASLVAVESH